VGDLDVEPLGRQPAPVGVRQRDLVFHDQHTHAPMMAAAPGRPGAGPESGLRIAQDAFRPDPARSAP
jgi:hypothetical protein